MSIWMFCHLLSTLPFRSTVSLLDTLPVSNHACLLSLSCCFGNLCDGSKRQYILPGVLQDAIETSEGMRPACHSLGMTDREKGSGGTTMKATTLHLTETVRSVFTPTTTLTPKSATVSTKSTIVKSTTKTLPRTTDTFSTTLSFTETSTISTTLISTSMPTSTEVVTSTLDTTTIAASSGFVPLSSALVASGHTVAKRRRAIKDRIGEAEAESAAVEERASQQKIICGSDGSISYDPPQYWGSVTCEDECCPIPRLSLLLIFCCSFKVTRESRSSPPRLLPPRLRRRRRSLLLVGLSRR